MNPEGIETYLLEETKAGTLLYGERLTPSPWGWVGLIAIPVLIFLGLVPSAGIAGSAAGMLGAVLFLTAGTVAGCLMRHQVRDRALLTGLSWRSARQYVLPWSTVDPSRIRLHRRANFIGRRLKEPWSYQYRFNPWNWLIVSVPGPTRELAHPRLRRGALDVLDPDDVDQNGYPTDTWYLGTRHPERLLRAIEQAMVASGRTDARGLAARELARPVVERWWHPLRDEDIYGRGPSDRT
ncbi:MAG: hypothetical protein JWN54_1323 [Mycobacterium sp.]|nr:hypothetical protein [Mycobacterium sp.]